MKMEKLRDNKNDSLKKPLLHNVQMFLKIFFMLQFYQILKPVKSQQYDSTKVF